MPESSPLRPARRPHSAASSAIAVAVLVLTGCTAPEEEHPLASPTSDTAVPAAEPTPAYTTELQLSEEEKTAVDEGLKQFDRYIEVSNEVFSSGGEGAEKFDAVAKDGALLSAKEEAQGLETDGVTMTGEFKADQTKVFDVDLDISDATAIPIINLHVCVPRDEYSYSDLQTSDSEASTNEFDTFEFILAEYDEEWFVSEQYLWANECDI